MIRGIYSSATGMLMGSRRLEVLSHNVSNAETPGFRADDSLLLAAPQHGVRRVASMEWQPVGVLGMGSLLYDSYTNQAQGELEQTGRSLDMALVGPGFFSVLRDGEVAYTRQGLFKRDAHGYLVTVDNHPVLSREGSPIWIPDGPLSITARGEVMVEDDVSDILAIVEFPDPAGLRKEHDTFFMATELAGAPLPAEASSVYQGFIERSNVNVLEHTVRLMMAARSYEASQRALKAQNETLGMAVREVGRV